jgi:hypothetical protein
MVEGLMLRKAILFLAVLIGVAASTSWISKPAGYAFSFWEIGHLLAFAYGMTLKTVEHIGSLYDTIIYLILYPIGVVLLLGIAVVITYKTLAARAQKNVEPLSSSTASALSIKAPGEPEEEKIKPERTTQNDRGDPTSTITIHGPIYVTFSNSGHGNPNKPRPSRRRTPKPNQDKTPH